MTRVKQHGFTVIELMLAMGFITMLLLGIALTVIQVATTYNKGITTTEVNQAGRALSTELSTAISQSGKFDINQFYHTTTTEGRLCLGQYSYLWNYAKAVQTGVTPSTKLSGEPIYFVKVRDAAQEYCAMNPSLTQFLIGDVRSTDIVNSSELLRPGDRELTMYQFDLQLDDVSKTGTGVDSLSGQELYTLSFTIGSGDIEAVEPDGTACLPPNDPNSNLPYCAIQQFELVIRAGNGVK